MRVYYDFHIHSALSPCGDDDMTPNNIIHMAKLKGLDAVALCDHNAAKNVIATAKIAKEVGITFLPGVEMTTAEEVHLVVLFAEAGDALAFGDVLYQALPGIQNRPDYFGNQLILDEQDEVVGTLDKLLISALPFDIDESCSLAQEYGGYVIPAHVNKEANSILANLGFFPPQLPFKTIEVVRGLAIDGDISGFQQIHSSDAHNLAQIAERENYLEVDENTPECILRKLCV